MRFGAKSRHYRGFICIQDIFLQVEVEKKLIDLYFKLDLYCEKSFRKQSSANNLNLYIQVKYI